MGIMTAHTIHHSRIDIDVGRSKRFRLHIMTFPAQPRNRLDQQGLTRGGMRLMAASAIALSRGMHLPLGHFFLEALVTGQAEIRTLDLEKFLQLRPMRIMTGAALVRNHGCMPSLIFLNGLHEFVMT